MIKPLLGMLAGCSLLLISRTEAATFADSVIAYTPGTGYATEFGTGTGFTNASAALGAPSSVTPGQFGGPVDPFNPPYLKEQLVSVGAGGSLTVGFSSPILNDPTHPFGLDFIIYGNAGFVITNGNFSGGGVTDGSLFGANPGTTRVSVSSDNLTYYPLNPAQAPIVDTLFPPDGSGSLDLAVNPALSGKDFAGLDVTAIRALYHGSAGGAGFDLAWAQDANGQQVLLPEVRYIRVDVLSGVAEIDGFSVPSSVPEPPPWSLLALGLAAGIYFRIRPARWDRGSQPPSASSMIMADDRRGPPSDRTTQLL